MPHYNATPDILVGEGVPLVTINIVPIYQFPLFNTVPPGDKRIAADNPARVILGSAPVSRIIDIFDKETNVHVARTTSSAIDGTYSFGQLPNREYFVICRGINGENDTIHTRVAPV
jgi:hypothetical protein